MRALVRVPGELVDAVSADLEALGAASVSIEAVGEEQILEPAPGAVPMWSRARVAALFDAAAGDAALAARIHAALAPRGVEHVELSALVPGDWENAWRLGAVARDFGHGLWVLPHDAPAPPAARTVVRLDPGLAFGTGSHATTALCLEWLAPRSLVGRTVLDLGCGSGILAIAAALLGAARVVAVDNDPQALAATRDNAAANGVGDRVEVGTVIPGGGVDEVLANILANTLVELAPVLTAACNPGAGLALSGILATQCDTVWRSYASGFEQRHDVLRGEWALIAARRCD
jgi:ribosomal protein L11 methyltransferase